MMIYGIGSRNTAVRYGSGTLFALALLGTFIDWPSVALIETYEIALIMVFSLLIARWDESIFA
jgi:hypothetical membrane protein